MSIEKKDIRSLDDIKLLVDTFYGLVRSDQLIGPIFITKIRDQWPEHLDKMYRFWQGILLGEHTYHGRPFPPHANLPVEREHFDRWLYLFRAAVDQLFKGPLAEEAKFRANSIADIFYNKLRYFRGA